MFYTYSIKNIENGKFYIGCRTAKCMLNRRPENDLGVKYFSSSKDKELRQAIKDDKVEYHVLQEYDDTTVCWKAEQQLIALYWKFFGHDMSYNHSYINCKGEKVFSMAGTHQSDKAKQILSEKHKGKKLSKEHKQNISEGLNNMSDEKKQERNEKFRETMNNRADEEKQNHYKKISEANKGKRNGMYGKHHSKETLEKISEAHKGKPLKKFQWLTPAGEIRIMDKGNAHRCHPDWTLIGPVKNNENN